MATWIRRVLLIGGPLALAVVLWWHPAGGENVYEGVRDDVDAWLTVHTAFLLATPLLGIAAFVLLHGISSRAATVSRIALVFFLVFYTAYESNVGIGTGILVDYANGLPASEQAVVADAIQDYNRNPLLTDPSLSLLAGGFGWIVAMIAAAVAFRQVGASWGLTLDRVRGRVRGPSAADWPDRLGVLRCGSCARRASARSKCNSTRVTTSGRCSSAGLVETYPAASLVLRKKPPPEQGLRHMELVGLETTTSGCDLEPAGA